MNIWILCAGFLGCCTVFAHVFAGHADTISPLFKSNLPSIPKITVLACWHMVTVTLLGTSVTLVYIGWYAYEGLYLLVYLIAIYYILFSAVFVVIGWFYFGMTTLINLPHWAFLLPTGVTGIYGVLWA